MGYLSCSCIAPPVGLVRGFALVGAHAAVGLLRGFAVCLLLGGRLGLALVASSGVAVVVTVMGSFSAHTTLVGDGHLPIHWPLCQPIHDR